MVVKMNNRNEEFYHYMGRVFGSRTIQLKTNDRIYDDASKEWYIYLKDGVPAAFISVAKNVIKNVYTSKEDYLLEILNEIQNYMNIEASIVPKVYQDIYVKAGFKVLDEDNYKNFVVIRGVNNE